MSTWYRTGTASFTNGSTSVSGSGTAWIANARTGDALHAPDGRAYEIASVNSNTSITLASAYLGSTASGADYAIQPTRGITVEFNDNAVSLLSTVQGFVDTALAGRFPNGSAGAPSHSFTSDTDTGMYRDAADRIGFSTGGTRRAFLSTTAMQIDVPVTGTATTQSPTDTTGGLLARFHGSRGIMGLGGTRAIVNTDWDNITDAGFYTNGSTSSELVGGPSSYTHMSLLHMRSDTGDSAAQVATRNVAGGVEVFARSRSGSGWSDWVEHYHTGNTTVDGSGNIMEASPIVRLYNTTTEEPNQPVGATMQRVGPGHYTLTGCPPLATGGWHTRDAVGPKGDTLATVGDPVWVGDTLHVRTYVDGQPADIPEGGFVMLRFWEAKEEGDEAPEVETLTEAQEQAAALEAERARMVCSRFQAKAALHMAGKLDAATAAVANADTVTQVAWAEAGEFKRTSPAIAALAPALEMTDAELDELFRTAMQIEA